MEARNSAAGDGRKEHRQDREPLRVGNAIFQGGKLGDRIFAAEKQYGEDSQRHEKQCAAETRIDTADDLVHGQQRRHDIIDQDNAQNDEQQPRETAEGNTRQRRGLDAVGDQRSGLRQEDSADEHHQPHGKDAHKLFYPRPEVGADGLGQTRTVAAQRDDPGDEVVRRPHEDTAEGNPQECHGAVCRPQHGTENRPQPRDIEQLYEESPPHRHRDIIHSVERRGRRHRPRSIHAAQAFEIASVGEICCHEEPQAPQESNHNPVCFRLVLTRI